MKIPLVRPLDDAFPIRQYMLAKIPRMAIGVVQIDRCIPQVTHTKLGIPSG